MLFRSRYMVYSYQGKRPDLSVYDNKTQVNTSGTTVSFDATQNTMTINFSAPPSNISINEKIRIAGEFAAADAVPASHINGREFTVNNVSGNSITINTTGLSFPDDSFTLTETDIYVMSDESEAVEAFFEGASDVYEGAAVNFSSEKIVIREIGDANKHAYTNTQMAITGSHTFANGSALASISGTNLATTGGTGTGATFDVSVDASGVATVTLNTAGSGYVVGDQLTIAGTSLTGGASPADDIVFTIASIDGILSIDSGQFSISQTVNGVALDSLDVLGLRTSASANDLTTTTDWVDEKAPALKINYNENTQQLEFRVDRTVLGTGTESNFNSFCKE